MVYTASECRFRQRCVPRTFKERLACATQHHPTLTTDEIADRARVRKAWLLKYANPNQDLHIPAEALIDVVRVTGRLDLLAVLVEQLDCEVIRRGMPDAQADVTLEQEALDVSASAGDLCRGVRDALKSDRRIDAGSEADTLRESIRRVRTELNEAEAALDAAVSRPVRAFDSGRRVS